MIKLKNPLLSELNRWAYADNILEALTQSKTTNAASPEAPVSGPLTGDGIVMGSSGVNAEVTALKEEYVEEYGRLTTNEAKSVFKNIFNEALHKPLLEIESYTDGQLDFGLDVASNALVLDYDKYVGFNPRRIIRAALDLWDTPDAEDLRDEIEDGFDDLSPISRAVVKRYDMISMGSGGILNYFKTL